MTNEMRRKTRSGHAITMALLALTVVGCGATTPPGTDLGDYTAAARDLIGVSSFTDKHLVRLSGRDGSLANGERERLAAFISDVAENRPDSLRVALHGSANPAELRAVAGALVADGIAPDDIVADRRFGSNAERGTIVVAVERAIAIDPNCPGWADHVAAPADNRSSPNFGCSDVSNFAAMVADPHQLREPASRIYHSGERGASSVASYRADKVKELPPLNESFTVIAAH